VSQDRYDPIVGLYNSIALEEQLYSSPPVFSLIAATAGTTDISVSDHL